MKNQLIRNIVKKNLIKIDNVSKVKIKINSIQKIHYKNKKIIKNLKVNFIQLKTKNKEDFYKVIIK